MLDTHPQSGHAQLGAVPLPCSDMAPNASGIHQLDHARILVRKKTAVTALSLLSLLCHCVMCTFCCSQDLCESALALSCTLLKEGGVFLCKLWQGGGLKGVCMCVCNHRLSV